MGYTTTFEGTVKVEPPLNEAEIAYLRKFGDTRRMDRANGPYFVGGTGFAGQGNDPDIRDSNRPPAGQPGLWCQWVPTDDGSGIRWDGNEKFYDSEEWMAYIIDHFLKPGAHAASSGDPQFAGFTFDHICNGEISAAGEEPGDLWMLVVTNNKVSRRQGRVTYS